jgi:hypothetical protein
VREKRGGETDREREREREKKSGNGEKYVYLLSERREERRRICAFIYVERGEERREKE